MLTRNKYTSLQAQLNELADWIEKHQHMHSDSLPRKAAYTIRRLEEENYQYKLLLNKRDFTIKEYINKYIGHIRYQVYKLSRWFQKVNK